MNESVAGLNTTKLFGYWAIAGCAMLLTTIYPKNMRQMLVFTLENMIHMLPVISIGVFIAACIAATGATAVIAKAFEGRKLWMIFLASVIGALLPVCGISVLPLVAGLLAARVPLGPIMAFWLASPITSPSMMAITAGTLGWQFALGKTLAAIGIGIFGGAITLSSQRFGWFTNPAKVETQRGIDADSCCVSHQSLCWKFWRSDIRRTAFMETTIYTGKLMLAWLTIAFMAEFWLKRYLSIDLLGAIVGSEQVFAVPLAALIGAPVYLNGFAALPLVRSLIESGMAPGAAMAFLVAGGITSAWAAIPVYALVRLSVFFLYLFLAIISAMISGWIYGLFVS